MIRDEGIYLLLLKLLDGQGEIIKKGIYRRKGLANIWGELFGVCHFVFTE